MNSEEFRPKSNTLVQAATEMHTDHEIQMAREACYRSASNAIELHRMLKHVSEQEGLDAWASEKISLANDYLRTVKEWLEYELMTKLENRVAENQFEVFESTYNEIANQGVAEGSEQEWEVSFEHGPHQSDSVKVKAASKEEAISKAKEQAKKTFRTQSLSLNWARPVKKGVAEGGIVKSIKRGLQGWGDGVKPDDIKRRAGEYSDDELKDIAGSHDELRRVRATDLMPTEVPKHSPAGLQKRLIDREMRKRGLGEQGVAEGYILKKTKVEKTFTPGDPDEYYTSGGADVTRKDTDYEIINNKTGQVVGTASWTTNDYFGPGALKITMKNGATRWLDIYPSERGNPQTAFNRFVKDPQTAKKYKEQGVAEGQVDIFEKKKPKPTSPDKWARAKAKAKSKFDVYPSAYANAYASKEYKKMGGGWRMGESTEEEQLDELKCWPGYSRVQGVPAGKPGSCKKKTK